MSCEPHKHEISKPKEADHTAAVRAAIADALGIPESQRETFATSHVGFPADDWGDFGYNGGRYGIWSVNADGTIKLDWDEED